MAGLAADLVAGFLAAFFADFFAGFAARFTPAAFLETGLAVRGDFFGFAGFAAGLARGFAFAVLRFGFIAVAMACSFDCATRLTRRSIRSMRLQLAAGNCLSLIRRFATSP